VLRRGKLSYTWPRSIGQIPLDVADPPAERRDARLFPFGCGLDAESSVPLELPDCPQSELDLMVASLGA
jgi:hypothetical protein